LSRYTLTIFWHVLDVDFDAKLSFERDELLAYSGNLPYVGEVSEVIGQVGDKSPRLVQRKQRDSIRHKPMSFHWFLNDFYNAEQ
jgi:hypothetical protein